ncbi:MAG: sugar phosphate isomerase/epimerase family protein [Candidatus Bipolaricaulia bacterium]
MEIAVVVESGLEQPDEVVERLKGQGVTAIESDYPPFIELPERVVEQIGQRLRDGGGRLWSVYAPFGGEYNLSNLNDRQRRWAVEIHKLVFQRAALAGASVAVIHPGGPANPDDFSRMLDLLRNSLNELLPVAEKYGIVLGLENMLLSCVRKLPRC